MERLWVIAKNRLGLTLREFSYLSYRQLKLLHEDFLLLRWQDQWQQGALYWAICNHGFRGYETNPPKIDDIVLVPKPEHLRVPAKRQAVAKRPRMTRKRRQQVTDGLRAFCVAMSGGKHG